MNQANDVIHGSKGAAHGKSDIENNTIPDSFRDFDFLPSSAGVRLKTVKKLLDCSAATVWRMAADGRLPAPEKISPGVTTWNVGKLREALAGSPK